MTIQILDKSKFSCYNEFMVLSKKRARKVIEEIIALYPDAKPSLDFRNHFELVCAVLLSAQTTDAAVNKATPGLFAAFPTPQAMAAAEVKDIEPYISRLGLYRNKAKFLKDCAQQLMERHNGIVPQTREELEALAGVGRKTANVVLSVGFGIPAFAVDTHVDGFVNTTILSKNQLHPWKQKNESWKSYLLNSGSLLIKL